MDDLRETVKAVLGGTKVRDVHAIGVVNADGQPVTRITVIYGGDGPAPSAQDMMALTNALWTKELESSGESFPVIDFVLATDAIAAE